MAVSAFRPAQTGEIVALKKVALRRLEDGIPNQALREIKALQEIEDNQYVSEAGVRGTSSRPPLLTPTLGNLHPFYWLICSPLSLPSFLVHVVTLIYQITSFLTHSLSCSSTYFFLYSSIHSLTYALFLRTV